MLRKSRGTAKATVSARAKAALIITFIKLTHYQFVGLRRASRYMRPIARASRCRRAPHALACPHAAAYE